MGWTGVVGFIHVDSIDVFSHSSLGFRSFSVAVVVGRGGGGARCRFGGKIVPCRRSPRSPGAPFFFFWQQFG